MKNVLNSYKKNNSIPALLGLVDKRLIEIISSAVRSGDCVLISRKLYRHLLKVDGSICDLDRLFVYYYCRSSVFLKSHKASRFIPPIVLKHMRKVLLKESACYSFPLFLFSEKSIRDIEFFYSADIDDPNNAQVVDSVLYEDHLKSMFCKLISDGSIWYLIKNESIYLTFDELKDIYMVMIKNGFTYKAMAKYMYFNRLNAFFERYFAVEDVHCLLGSLLKVIDFDGAELSRFMTGYYTDIPYFKKMPVIKRAFQLSYFNNASLSGGKEMLIQGEGSLIHLIFEDCRYDKLLKLTRYELNKPAKFKFGSYEIDVDSLSDEEIDLVAMILYDDVIEFTDFRYNKKHIYEIGMLGQNKNAFTDYLLDRAGLYHRWKRK